MSMSSNAVIIFDVRKTAFNFERLNALTKLSVDINKTAFDADALNALTKLSNCQTAAFGHETTKCTLAVF